MSRRRLVAFDKQTALHSPDRIQFAITRSNLVPLADDCPTSLHLDLSAPLAFVFVCASGEILVNARHYGVRGCERYACYYSYIMRGEGSQTSSSNEITSRHLRHTFDNTLNHYRTFYTTMPLFGQVNASVYLGIFAHPEICMNPRNTQQDRALPDTETKHPLGLIPPTTRAQTQC